MVTKAGLTVISSILLMPLFSILLHDLALSASNNNDRSVSCAMNKISTCLSKLIVPVKVENDILTRAKHLFNLIPGSFC
jgi:hypothetical protein